MFEKYLAYPFRWLASWAQRPYDGEWRNGCAAHVMGGWALMLTAGLIHWSAMIPVVLYPIYREWEDSGWKWDRKNWADLMTFYFGEVIGCGLLMLLK